MKSKSSPNPCIDADGTRADIERMDSESQTPSPQMAFNKRMNMKGNTKLVATLNELLADELTAISQYMVHAEMCANWGYEALHQAIERQAHDDEGH